MNVQNFRYTKKAWFWVVTILATSVARPMSDPNSSLQSWELDTHISEQQLEITFLDVSYYSEYSDTNISDFIFFFGKKASSVRKQ